MNLKVGLVEGGNVGKELSFVVGNDNLFPFIILFFLTEEST